MGGGELTPRLRLFAPGNDPVPTVVGGWVGPRSALDVLEKRKKYIFPLPGFEPLPPSL